MSRKISFTLNTKSIDKAIRQVQQYQNWIEAKRKELLERLAYIGAKEATARFNSAYYTGNKDVSVNVEPTKNGWKIVASGSAVFFIEFGAGVYYNGSEPYPNPRPNGIVGIGEYGEGKGKQSSWGYYNEYGELIITHGTPAAMPMYHASEEMRKEVLKVAREVFG